MIDIRMLIEYKRNLQTKWMKRALIIFFLVVPTVSLYFVILFHGNDDFLPLLESILGKSQLASIVNCILYSIFDENNNEGPSALNLTLPKQFIEKHGLSSCFSAFLGNVLEFISLAYYDTAASVFFKYLSIFMYILGDSLF